MTPIQAPDGWCTLNEAAERRGLTYSVVYRHVAKGLVKTARMSNGAIILPEGELEKISKHEPPVDRKRIAVQLVPNTARHRAWAAKACEYGISVTELCYRLMDRASGLDDSWDVDANRIMMAAEGLKS